MISNTRLNNFKYTLRTLYDRGERVLVHRRGCSPAPLRLEDINYITNIEVSIDKCATKISLETLDDYTTNVVKYFKSGKPLYVFLDGFGFVRVRDIYDFNNDGSFIFNIHGRDDLEASLNVFPSLTTANGDRFKFIINRKDDDMTSILEANGSIEEPKTDFETRPRYLVGIYNKVDGSRTEVKDFDKKSDVKAYLQLNPQKVAVLYEAKKVLEVNLPVSETSV